MRRAELTRREFSTALCAIGMTTATSLMDPRLSCGVEDAPKEYVQIGSRRELFMDDALIDRVHNLRRRIHQPIPQEIVFPHDAPWEGTGSGMHSIFRDGDKVRMYYRGAHLKLPEGNINNVLCLAESSDGIDWARPSLGRHEFQGSRENNIVLTSGPTTGLSLPLDVSIVAAWRDENPAAPAEATYKALVGTKGDKGLYAFGSPDGITWRPLKDTPVLTSGKFDTMNTACWDPQRAVYRAYCRSWSKGDYKGLRGIRTATSPDFLTWSPFESLEYASPLGDMHLYTNGIKPYYRAPHIFVGFPMRYIERGWSDSMRALPDLPNREARSKYDLRYGTALTDSLLMSSRDGKRFQRFDEAFLRPGIERAGTWQYGNQGIAWHVVETKSPLDGHTPELSIYATERQWHGPGTALRRYTLRLDGFVSLQASAGGGEMLTKPLQIVGDTLTLNFATSAAGSIQVELQNAAGRPLPGFALADSQELFGDTIQRTVTWRGGAKLLERGTEPIRVRFVLRDADLYALQFRTSEA